MRSFPQYSIEEYVVYEGKVYKVTSIYALNWSLNVPFVYGMILAHNVLSEPYAHKELLVRENLLQKATLTQIGTWKTLYGRGVK